MQAQQTIFVTGATGNQGGAVARSLVNHGFRVKGLTRDPSSVAAKKLTQEGVEIVQGNLNNLASLDDHLIGCDGVFSVQAMSNKKGQELNQANGLADLAKAQGIKQFLYSSAAGVELDTKIPHWDSKLKAENHLRSIGIPYTIIRPTFLYENFLIPDVKKRILKGRLPSAMGKNVLQQFVSSKDIGEISATIFRNQDKFAGKAIPLAAEEADMGLVAVIFSEALGRPVKFQKLPWLVARLALGRNLYKMFRWISKNGDRILVDLDKVKHDLPNPIGLKEWIGAHFNLTPANGLLKH